MERKPFTNETPAGRDPDSRNDEPNAGDDSEPEAEQESAAAMDADVPHPGGEETGDS